MFQILTNRLSNHEWLKDLDMAFESLNCRREKTLINPWKIELSRLCDLLNAYTDITAVIIPLAELKPGFCCGIKVKMKKLEVFEAYIKPPSLLAPAEVYYTKQAHTEEFPLTSVIWKTELMVESEAEDPAYVVATIKNHVISYFSFQIVGREITYSILEE